MAKSKKKQWLATMRRARWVELVPNGSSTVTWRRVPISEARANQLHVAASKTKLANGAHNSVFQYADGAKPLLYSYTSGCKCYRCTPKDWYRHFFPYGGSQLRSIVREAA